MLFPSSSAAAVAENQIRSVNVSGTRSCGGIACDTEGIRSDPSSKHAVNTLKALKIGVSLQTTLNPEMLLRHFSRGVGEAVNHSGISFHSEDGEFELSLGRKAKHNCTFTMILEQETLGHLILTRGRPFLEQEVEQLDYLTSVLAYPLRNALAHQSALQASMTDPLTGIYNRSIVGDTLRREIRLARRFGNPLSIILFDIDGLKQVNDQAGHERGDEAIKAVVNCISHNLRETDIFARYGGDEFVILLNNTSKKGARTLARHMLDRTHDKNCLDMAKAAVTLSIGVATLKKGEGEKSFLRRVDKAMYLAKGQGGDRIQAAGGGVIAKSVI